MESHLGCFFLKHELSAPVPTAHARPLPPTGPPFPARTPSSPPPQPTIAEDSDEDASDEDDEDASDEDDSDEDEE